MNDQSIFISALEQPPEARQAFVDQACQGDSALQRRVERLLAAHDNAAADFLGEPAGRLSPTQDQRPLERAGTKIGPYKLLQKIGEGGMGVVWMAEQEHPVRRRVALKIIKPGMDSQQVIARFEAERQALALMDHTNIAKVLDAGTTGSSRPYFVMELVKGVPITTYCDELNLPIRERLALSMPVCQAVQHAHSKGIIHRDIKPSNVLIAMQDGVPVPKVIDFGVAKALTQPLTERTLMTEFGAVVGTLEYMSPEQAELSALDIDTRADVYALGVLLYELLTGTTPLDRKRLKTAALEELLRIIREVEPPRPSTRLSSLSRVGSAHLLSAGDAAADPGGHSPPYASLASVAALRKTEPAQLAKLVRGDLDWIVMKALEKDRTRRYETASGLARDVDRFLHDEPIEARPPSAAYRLRKLARKHRLALVTASAFAAVLITSTIFSSWQAWQATQLRHTAQAQARLAWESSRKADLAAAGEKLAHLATRRQRYADVVNLASEAWSAGDLVRMEKLLTDAATLGDGRGFEIRMLRWLHGRNEPVDDMVFSSPAASVAVSQLNGAIAVGLQNGEIRLRRPTDTSFQLLEPANDARNRADFLRHLSDVEFTADGTHLVAGCCKGTKERDAGEIKIWEVSSGKLIGTVPHDGEVMSLAIGPDGRLGASGDASGSIKVWRVDGGEVMWSKDKLTRVLDLSISPDGENFASAHLDQYVRTWSVRDGTPRIEKLIPGVVSLDYSPDGASIAVASNWRVHIWNVVEDSTWHETAQVIPAGGWEVRFSPDGRRLGLVGPDATLRIWNVPSWRESKRLYLRHAGTGLAFLGDEKVLASSLNRHVYVWPQSFDAPEFVDGAKHYILPLDVSGQGEVVTGRESDNGVVIWDAGQASSPRILYRHGARVSSTAFSQDGSRIGSGDADGWVIVADRRSGLEMTRWQHSGVVHAIDFSPNGTLVASAGHDGKVLVHDIAGARHHELDHRPFATSVCFSPDGKYLATGGGAYWAYGETKIWDLSDRQPRPVKTFDHPNVVLKVKFSRNGKFLAAIDDFIGGVIRVWNVPSFEERFELKGHNSQTSSFDFLADEDCSRLVTASADGTVKFWDTASGTRIGTFSVNERIREIRFFPDSNGIVTASNEGFVRIWRAMP